MEAAALCKMADRRQITGGILDGPLAFDNAVSAEAAKTKGIVSPVAGQADIFVVPDLEAGNMLAKQLEYLAEADVAGIVLGARVPIILTSRADKTLARLGSCAIALILARHKDGGEALIDAILVLNAGSSSIKFALFPRRAATDRTGTRSAKASLREFATARISRPRIAPARCSATKLSKEGATHEDAIAALLTLAGTALSRSISLIAAGHRVVHGGLLYKGPVLIDAEVIAELHSLSFRSRRCTSPITSPPLPHSRNSIRRCRKSPASILRSTRRSRSVAAVYALPRRLTDEGVRRYGFHGLSYEYIASVLPEVVGSPGADGAFVVAHLGSGASMCGMKQRRSVATTMGFTALDGLPMARRCGSLDPGVVLYLLEQKGMTAAAASDLLYQSSGLLGVSGISDDMRTLLASDKLHAAEAVDLFVYRICRELGSLVAALGRV